MNTQEMKNLKNNQNKRNTKLIQKTQKNETHTHKDQHWKWTQPMLSKNALVRTNDDDFVQTLFRWNPSPLRCTKKGPIVVHVQPKKTQNKDQYWNWTQPPCALCCVCVQMCCVLCMRSSFQEQHIVETSSHSLYLIELITWVQGTIWTCISPPASTRVSPYFSLFRRSSQSFGCWHLWS